MLSLIFSCYTAKKKFDYNTFKTNIRKKRKRKIKKKHVPITLNLNLLL